MMEQLPALQVLIPLLAAPLCVILHNGRIAWLIAFITSLCSLSIAILLSLQVQGGEVISYHMGNWEPPWGIEYRVDRLNVFILIIISLVSSVALPYAYRSAPSEVHENKLYLLYAGWLIVLTGLLGMTITGDAFNVFVFLEISALSTYLIIALSRDRRALIAAFQYLLLGTIGASFILLSMGLLYQATGTLNMHDLSQRLPTVSHLGGVKIAFAFMLIGVGLKVAIVPLHAWLVGAYRYAPTAVTVFLAGSATKVAIYVLIRFIYSVYGDHLSFEQFQLGHILLPLALLSMFIPALIATQQKNVKRLLAFSSLSQIGYMLLGISMHNADGLTASVLHLFNHALMKTALFMSVGILFFHIGSQRLTNIAGLGRIMPITFTSFIVASLSLIGVPLTAGFVSKWYLVLGALQNEWWGVAIMILLSSLLAVIYLWKVVEVAYFKPARLPNAREELNEAPLGMLIPLVFMVAANLWFGINTDWPLSHAQGIATQLLGGH